MKTQRIMLKCSKRKRFAGKRQKRYLKEKQLSAPGAAVHEYKVALHGESSRSN